MPQPPQSADPSLMKVHSIEHESLFTKDQRTFDHDKQRRMKAGAFFKANARKGQGVVVTGPKPVLYTKNTPNPPSTSEKQRCLWEDADLVYLDDTRAPEGDHVWKMLEPDGLSARDMMRMTEVKLSDLITVRKSRNGKEGDFEVIPHMRSVIVLDDFPSSDLGADEPWEHITGGCDADPLVVFTTSYAQVVAMAD